MFRNLAIKKLQASDLTLFKSHSQKYTPQTNRGISLSSSIFIDEFYPSLPETVSLRTKLQITLYVYGPQNSGELDFQRMITKDVTFKSWRLNGELIANPYDAPNRFDVLSLGDIAILEFTGRPTLTTIRMILLAAAAPQDWALHMAFTKLFEKHGSRQTFIALSQAQLDAAIKEVGLNKPHVIDILQIEKDLEEAALGIQESIQKIRTGPSQRTISPEDLQTARDNATRHGRSGEEIVASYLQSRKDNGEIQDFEWVSRINAISPYDFRVTDNNGSVIYIDAKSTVDVFDRAIHISLNELYQMNSEQGRYDIYRVYEMGENTARIAIATNLRNFAANVLKAFSNLPDGVSADGISVRPSKIQHSWQHQVIHLTSSEEGE